MRNAIVETSKQTMLLDSALLQRTSTGDQQAFEMLVRRYHATLYYQIYRLVRNEDQAQDVLQHVWLQLYLSAPRLQSNQTIRAWLFRVARNRCLDLLRQKSPLYFSELETAEGEIDQTFQERVLDCSSLPEEQAEDHELQRALFFAIQHLPGKQRSIVFLRYTEELSFGEIGRRLGIPMRAAKITFYRARPLLSKAMAGWITPPCTHVPAH
jgi:RNA polymerase sigma factor (sigma-70 family)